MRVISVKLNGIREAADNGFFDWLKEQNADFICLQNIKAKAYQLESPVFYPSGYEPYFFDADQDGFGGVAIYSRFLPKAVMSGLGFEICDFEGRFIQADFEKVSVSCIYFPEGSADFAEQQKKYAFMEHILAHLKKIRRKRRDFIYCGALHMAHKTIDLSNWQASQTLPGFLAEERAWMDQLFGPVGFVDAFREINREEKQYTWWPSVEHQERNTEGWRLDYQFVTPNLRNRIRGGRIARELGYLLNAPVIIDYDMDPQEFSVVS